MSRRNQPYIPLYVQDYLTDEKLNMCSAAAQGIYIKIMCVMHKSERYGAILLKQKDKQNESKIIDFAAKIAKLLTFERAELAEALRELTDEGVLQIVDDTLQQPRMIRDAEISEKRASAGAKGGGAVKKRDFAKAKPKAKKEQKTEYEIEYEDEVKTENEKGGAGGKAPLPADPEPSYQASDFWSKIPLDHLREDLKTAQQWKEQISRECFRAGFQDYTPQRLDAEIDRFFTIIANDGEESKTLKDAKKHFNRWLMYELQKPKRQKDHGQARENFAQYVAGRTDI